MRIDISKAKRISSDHDTDYVLAVDAQDREAIMGLMSSSSIPTVELAIHGHVVFGCLIEVKGGADGGLIATFRRTGL